MHDVLNQVDLDLGIVPLAEQAPVEQFYRSRGKGLGFPLLTVDAA